MADDVICPCENESHGDLGPVADEENVARVIVSPNHFRKGSNALKPSAFPLSHIATSGLSLLRTDCMDSDQAHQLSCAIAGQMQNQTAVGLAKLSTSALRGLRDDEDVRMLCVVDDPVAESESMPANPGHAFAISSISRSDPEILAIQQAIYDLVNDIERFDDTG
ncbi:hypothetical protein [Sinorhizobium fredii]|uniref:hypothetical protein n=1 Tax=Rhizobium fredii TaxID=380 RepID=UPI001297283E|nr:hypothetical protein [Sinorhizobium fredii]MQW94091.1 hypothetical protein [Sinorhizobium fredii]